jgi:hypothetical protein
MRDRGVQLADCSMASGSDRRRSLRVIVRTRAAHRIVSRPDKPPDRRRLIFVAVDAAPGDTMPMSFVAPDRAISRSCR